MIAYWSMCLRVLHAMVIRSLATLNTQVTIHSIAQIDDVLSCRTHPYILEFGTYTPPTIINNDASKEREDVRLVSPSINWRTNAFYFFFLHSLRFPPPLSSRLQFNNALLPLHTHNTHTQSLVSLYINTSSFSSSSLIPKPSPTVSHSRISHSVNKQTLQASLISFSLPSHIYHI
mgnify:CR=1 FL=1